jgi:polyhydroxyalkanoate synthase
MKTPAKSFPKTPRRSLKAETAQQTIAQAPRPEEAPRAAPLPPVASHSSEAPIYGHMTNSIDRMVRALQGRATLGLSPASILMAYLDWLVHFSSSMGKMSELDQNAAMKSLSFMVHSLKQMANPSGEPEPFIAPLPQDRRFSSPEWKQWPFSQMVQNFLMAEQWWHYATTGVRGVSKHHEDVVSFGARQLLDMMAPSNSFFTNPDVLKATFEQGGQNLIQGFTNFLEDMDRSISGKRPAPTAQFEVGKTVGVTPGKVILKNDLIELIQYAPATPDVLAEPILIVPAWIMKYYILDLSPHNSLVKFLVDKGHTVFMISWKNPGPEDRNVGMEEYRNLGVMAALDAISAVMPKRKVHAAGYCLGGTLLAIAASAMARDGDHRLASVTLLAAQADFEDAGEIMLFIDESQVVYLEDQMWDKGVLDTKQMAGAFQLLRSNDLIWSRVVSHYLLGEPETMNDLMAWNTDATRMPYRMHSEYLRHLFLDNELAKGRYLVGGRPVALADIRIPIFAVGTVKDHVAPWKSVYKIGLLSDTDVTFLLTSGGHNAGIVSEPGHGKRSFQMATQRAADKFVDPESWQAAAPRYEGSWWPAWEGWIADRSPKARVKPPGLGNAKGSYPALYDAPGRYVMIP